LLFNKNKRHAKEKRNGWQEMQRLNEISYPMNMAYMNTLVEMALEYLNPTVASPWEGYFLPKVCGCGCCSCCSFPPMFVDGWCSDGTRENATMREMIAKWEWEGEWMDDNMCVMCTLNMSNHENEENL